MRPVAYPPIRQASWPAAPHWHAPAMELDVVYPIPGPYARRKDASVSGSFSYAPFMATGLYGAAPAAAAAPAPVAAAVVPPAPVKVKRNKEREKAVGEQLKNLFKKDESGISKAEKIAKRALALTAKPPPPPPPAPVIVQAPAPASSGMAGATPLILTGVTAFVLGAGIGFVVGRR